MTTTHLSILSLLLACAATLEAAEITICAPDLPMVRFARGKLEAALERQADTLKWRVNQSPDPRAEIVATVDPTLTTDLGAEGFRRVRSHQGLEIIASNERGAMYGLLDLTEELRSGTPLDRIPDRTARAELEFRAIKFNLPWSAYRTSPALEQHQDTCKDLKYWEAFLDMMAENQFNVLSLWSPHPYTHMIRPRNFPEACPFNDAELAEWKKLWSGIFAMARERGIETYLLNWNIFVSPEFSRAHNVAPWSVSLSHIGKEADATSELVVRYTKEVVTQVLDEYPDLTGLGITLGERMGGMTPDQRRDWLDQTFFAGIAQAQRPAKLIYRAPLSANTGSGGTTSEENDRRSRAQIESLTNNLTGPVYIEFKHNWSHAHSSPDLFIVHGGKLSDAYWNPPPTRRKVVWTMRNEDMFNIADYVKTGRVPEGAMSPIELAATLERDGATAMEWVAELRARGGVSPTFDCELTDIEAWCAYGNYFAGKLRAGVTLAMARAAQDLKQQQRAVAELEKALVHWKRLAELGAKFNQLPVPSNSKEPFSWSALTPAVEKDIEIAKAPLTSTNSNR